MAVASSPLVNWPLAVAGMLRVGAASAADLDIGDRVRAVSSRDIGSWVEGLSDLERDRLVGNLGTLLALLDEIEEAPAGVSTWPAAMTADRRETALSMLGLPPSLRDEVHRRNPLAYGSDVSPLIWVDPDARPAHGAD